MRLKAAQPTPVPAAPDGGVPDAGAAEAGSAPADAAPALTDAAAPKDVAMLAPDLAPDANLGDVPIGPCGFQDPNEPTNDSRETATLLSSGVPIPSCISGKDPASDSDYFELVAPDDPAGGYFQVGITEVANDRVGVTTYAATDNTIILDGFAPADPGASTNLFFAAAPGQHYRLLIVYGGYDFQYKLPFRYTIKATFTKITDAYEPNDTRAAARSITLGTPITAHAFAGFTTGHAGFSNGRLGPTPTADWYKVEVTGSMLKATVENTASDVRIALFAYDSLGTERSRADSVTLGAGASVMIPATPGTYYLQVFAADQGPAAAGPGLTVSPSFTMPYTLTVTQ
jgi:hypothetical protein